MAHIHGKGGDLAIDAGASTTGARNWTIDFTGDPVETTDYADLGTKTFIAGQTGWTATFEVVKDGAPPHAMNASVTFDFEEIADDANAVWTGTCIINSIGVSVPIDGVVVYTYGAQGTGTLTVASG